MDIKKGIICIQLINICFKKYQNKFKKKNRYVLLYYKTLDFHRGKELEEFIDYILSDNLDELKKKENKVGPFPTIFDTETGDYPKKGLVIPRDRRCVIESISRDDEIPPNMCIYVNLNENIDEIRMIRDSGADFTMLSKETRIQCNAEFHHLTLINSSIRPLFIIKKLIINDFVFRNVIINETNMDDCIGQDIATCCKIIEDYEKGTCKMIPFTTNIKYKCPTITKLGLQKEYVDQLLIDYKEGKKIDSCEVIEKLFQLQDISINKNVTDEEKDVDTLLKEYDMMFLKNNN